MIQEFNATLPTTEREPHKSAFAALPAPLQEHLIERDNKLVGYEANAAAQRERARNASEISKAGRGAQYQRKIQHVKDFCTQPRVAHEIAAEANPCHRVALVRRLMEERRAWPPAWLEGSILGDYYMPPDSLVRAAMQQMRLIEPLKKR